MQHSQHTPNIETHPLRRARLKQSLSYRRFAGMAGLSWRHIERWERGESIPSLTNAEVIMRILPGFKSPEQVRLACLKWQQRYVPEKVKLGNRNRGPLVRSLRNEISRSDEASS